MFFRNSCSQFPWHSRDQLIFNTGHQEQNAASPSLTEMFCVAAGNSEISAYSIYLAEVFTICSKVLTRFLTSKSLAKNWISSLAQYYLYLSKQSSRPKSHFTVILAIFAPSRDHKPWKGLLFWRCDQLESPCPPPLNGNGNSQGEGGVEQN